MVLISLVTKFQLHLDVSSVPVITLNGVSKVYYAHGWRIGYMALRDQQNPTRC